MTQAKKIVLNEAQERAARAPMGPLLIVAGAGTGKTSTLVNRLLYLIESGVPSQKICAITFTNKAASEMADRIARYEKSAPRSPGRRNAPYIGTFHSLGAKILRRECRSFGREPNFAIFDDHDSFELVKKAVKGVSPGRKSEDDESILVKTKKDEAPAFFVQKIAEIKNGVFAKGGKRAQISPEKENQIKIVFNAYEASLKRNNAFDFDDLIQKPNLLFQKNPAALKRYRALFDAVLVDEWQDINPVQYEFVKLLAGGHRNLSVVGDDEQTIYTWRYADIKTFLNFNKDWDGAAVYFLEENYRSTATIVNAAQAVVQNNRFRTPKKLRTSNPEGDRIRLFEAWGENDEAAWIAETISSARAADPRGTIGVLYRTNAQSRAVEQALVRNDIPYHIFGGLKFYERREVKDAIAGLRYAANPKDELSAGRLEKNLSRRKFGEFKNAVAAAKDPTPADILSLFLETFGYFDYLEQNFINADEREENISELAAFAAEFKTLGELLEKISLAQSTDAPSGGNAKKPSGDTDGMVVHLSTIHLAKGLEFDTVFIAGVAEGILPHIRSMDDENSLEEERRLMYVAMTRARKKLFVSFSSMPSRFLSEIPEEYLLATDSGQGDGGGIDPEPADEDYFAP
jgi:DNA helicase-2/ATP-dependent DNA helicase PcrA